MRLAVHDYAAEDVRGIVDGAILMHREMLPVLARSGAVLRHDLTRGPEALDGLGEDDVVYAGSGPYAFLYHLWRERRGGRYRIVREVHTALWSGYWSQEELCAPLRRDGDLALFPSEYARRLFAARFPGLARGSAVAYPMLHRLPAAPPRPLPSAGATLRLGYLGALSTAKNFDQVLAVFRRLHAASGGRATLTFAGKPNDPRWQGERVLAELAAAGVPRQAVRPLGVVAPGDLAGFFAAVDVLLFPSTASRETLGRVVVEALAHGVPVLAAAVGPAVELLPPENLLPTCLATGRAFTMGRVEALGQVDADAAVERLLARRLAPAALPDREVYGGDSFARALAARPAPPPARHDREISDRLRVAARPPGEAERALPRAERLVLDYFARRDEALLGAIAGREQADGRRRDDLRGLLGSGPRSLADYRALPRLLEALVLPPLAYTLDGRSAAAGAAGAAERS